MAKNRKRRSVRIAESYRRITRSQTRKTDSYIVEEIDCNEYCSSFSSDQDAPVSKKKKLCGSRKKSISEDKDYVSDDSQFLSAESDSDNSEIVRPLNRNRQKMNIEYDKPSESEEFESCEENFQTEETFKENSKKDSKTDVSSISNKSGNCNKIKLPDSPIRLLIQKKFLDAVFYKEPNKSESKTDAANNGKTDSIILNEQHKESFTTIRTKNVRSLRQKKKILSSKKTDLIENNEIQKLDGAEISIKKRRSFNKIRTKNFQKFKKIESYKTQELNTTEINLEENNNLEPKDMNIKFKENTHSNLDNISNHEHENIKKTIEKCEKLLGLDPECSSIQNSSENNTNSCEMEIDNEKQKKPIENNIQKSGQDCVQENHETLILQDNENFKEGEIETNSVLEKTNEDKELTKSIFENQENNFENPVNITVPENEIIRSENSTENSTNSEFFNTNEDEKSKGFYLTDSVDEIQGYCEKNISIVDDDWRQYLTECSDISEHSLNMKDKSIEKDTQESFSDNRINEEPRDIDNFNVVEDSKDTEDLNIREDHQDSNDTKDLNNIREDNLVSKDTEDLNIRQESENINGTLNLEELFASYEQYELDQNKLQNENKPSDRLVIISDELLVPTSLPDNYLSSEPENVSKVLATLLPSTDNYSTIEPVFSEELLPRTDLESNSELIKDNAGSSEVNSNTLSSQCLNSENCVCSKCAFEVGEEETTDEEEEDEDDEDLEFNENEPYIDNKGNAVNAVISYIKDYDKDNVIVGFRIPRTVRTDVNISISLPLLDIDESLYRIDFKEMFYKEIEELEKLKKTVEIEEGNLWIPLKRYERYINDERAKNKVVCKMCDEDCILARSSIKMHIIGVHWKIKLFKCPYCLDKDSRHTNFAFLCKHISNYHL